MQVRERGRIGSAGYFSICGQIRGVGARAIVTDLCEVPKAKNQSTPSIGNPTTGTHVQNRFHTLYHFEVCSVLGRWEDRRGEGIEVQRSRARRKREGERVDICDTGRVYRKAELWVFLAVLGSEFICKKMDDICPVDGLEGENDREELEPGRVGRVNGQGDPLWGYAAAEGEGGLLGLGDGRAGLEKVGLLDGGEDVEVGEGGEDEDADDTLYG